MNKAKEILEKLDVIQEAELSSEDRKRMDEVIKYINKNAPKSLMSKDRSWSIRQGNILTANFISLEYYNKTKETVASNILMNAPVYYKMFIEPKRDEKNFPEDQTVITFVSGSNRGTRTLKWPQARVHKTPLIAAKKFVEWLKKNEKALLGEG